METTKLIATKRTLLGNKVKSLRRKGGMPAVVYGKGGDSVPITIDAKTFSHLFKDVGESGLIELSVGKDQSINVIVSDVDVHPVTDEILHANLRRVSLREKISANVPIVLEGESSAVKSGEGIVLQLMNEIEVTCLPQDIPHEIVIDVTPLENVDDTITVKELPIDKEKIIIETDGEELVVKIDYATQPEVEEEEEVSEEELVEGVEATEETEKEKDGEDSAGEKPTKETDQKPKKDEPQEPN